MLTSPVPASPTYASYSGLNLSATSTSQVCGDDRDQLTPEYVTYGADFFPTCFEFMSGVTYALQFASASQSFPFSTQMNTDDIKAGDHPSWAILRNSMVNGSLNVQTTYGQQMKINSAYRSPKVQSKHGHPHDRHIHGDAVDIATTQLTYQSMRNAALQASSQQTCVEDFATAAADCKNQSPACNPYNHVHVDWRRVASPPPTAACKQSWMK